MDVLQYLLVARRPIVLAGLFLQRLLQDLLQHLRRRVVVEGHVGHHVIVAQLRELLVDQDGLAAPRGAHEHHRLSQVDQQVQEVLDADGFCKGLLL